MKIYVASKSVHAPMWRSLRAAGLPIISTWIDEAGEGETVSWTKLWQRCIDEASEADAVLAYYEPGEEWKGAYVEIGAHLATHPHPMVSVCGVPPGSWVQAFGVNCYSTLEAAILAVMA